MKTVLIAMALILGAGMVQAAPLSPDAVPIINEHGGGLNSEGCHNDTKRGTYHCH